MDREVVRLPLWDTLVAEAAVEQWAGRIATAEAGKEWLKKRLG